MQNSITTPEDFFEKIVTPDVTDYMNDQGDIRKAFHACMSLDHLRDWVAKAKGEDTGSFTAKIYKLCPEAQTVREISANTKHFPPTKAQVIHIETTAKNITIGEIDIPLDDMLGTWDSWSTPQTIAKLEDGQTNWITLLVNKTYVFWKKNYFNK